MRDRYGLHPHPGEIYKHPRLACGIGSAQSLRITPANAPCCRDILPGLIGLGSDLAHSHESVCGLAKSKSAQ